MWYLQQSPSGTEFIDWKVNQNCHIIDKSILPNENIEVDDKAVIFDNRAVMTLTTGQTSVFEVVKHPTMTEMILLREATEFEIELTQMIRKNRQVN